MIICMISVMNVELGVCGISAIRRNDRASIMNELSTQDIGIRSTTTLIDSRISCLASRSHGQGVVVEKDLVVKVPIGRIIHSKKAIKSLGNRLKVRKGYFALIATHAKKGIVDCRRGKGFSFPIKGMAKRTQNVHCPKIINLPSRIKRKMCNREMQRWLWLWWLWQVNNIVK